MLNHHFDLGPWIPSQWCLISFPSVPAPFRGVFLEFIVSFISPRWHFQDGAYEVVHKLGYGGFSTVWLVKDKKQGQYAGIKILRAEAPTSEVTFSFIFNHLLVLSRGITPVLGVTTYTRARQRNMALYPGVHCWNSGPEFSDEALPLRSHPTEYQNMRLQWGFHICPRDQPQGVCRSRNPTGRLLSPVGIRSSHCC